MALISQRFMALVRKKFADMGLQKVKTVDRPFNQDNRERKKFTALGMRIINCNDSPISRFSPPPLP